MFNWTIGLQFTWSICHAQRFCFHTLHSVDYWNHMICIFLFDIFGQIKSYCFSNVISLLIRIPNWKFQSKRFIHLQINAMLNILLSVLHSIAACSSLYYVNGLLGWLMISPKVYHHLKLLANANCMQTTMYAIYMNFEWKFDAIITYDVMMSNWSRGWIARFRWMYQ